MKIPKLNKAVATVEHVTDRAEGMDFSETGAIFSEKTGAFCVRSVHQQYKMRSSNNSKCEIVEKGSKWLIANDFGHSHFVLFSGVNLVKSCVYLKRC